MANKGRFGIVVGGGPAPGINGVIGSVAIEAIANGYEVLGFREGFSHLSKGKPIHENLTIDAVSRIHLAGGSILATSRVNPTKDPKLLDNVVKSLADLGVTHLVTIGGDDTAFSSAKVSDHAMASLGLDLRVVHVPKTIDNDLPLPEGVPTFGYQTAREIGAQLVKNLSEDAKTTRRWYFVIMMGRTAGHLALGVGKSAGATVTIIPEEFPGPVPLATIADILATSMIKRQAMGKPFGVAVIAEGLAERLTQDDLKFLENVERDAHGHVRLSEVDFGEIVKQATKKVLDERGIKTSIIDKEIGYELRCAPPVAFDVEYTRNLGYAAVKFLLDGGSKAMISIQGERIVPMPFDEIRDPKTGKTSVRRVNVESLQYQIAQKYMIKLTAADLADAGQCAKLADVAGMTPEAFKKRFGHLTAGS